MKITSAEFVASAVRADQWPGHGLPEIAFAGRSNVGKSSLINTLLNRKSLVKVSSTPGKTQTVNFFLVNGSLMFVDLPGYGYAKAPRRVRESWGPMVENYLNTRGCLKGVIWIVDSRRGLTELDRELHRWLGERGLPFLLAAMKVDKLKRSQRGSKIKEIEDSLGDGPRGPVVPFSAVTREGRRETWRWINDLCLG